MNIGNILIYGALGLSFLSLFFIVKSAGGNKFYWISARQIYYLCSLMVFFSVIVLLTAFLTDDFRYAYVYENSAKEMATVYKVAALWAGKEGSFLLWLLFLCAIGVVVLKTEKKYQNIVLGITIITQIFIMLLLAAESPFRFVWDAYAADFAGRTSLPDNFNGLGMNPLLLDPWMVSHPPLLFLGYASSIVLFGYAAAAILKNDYQNTVDKAYRWTLFSMTTLGIGIFLGGFWAYKVLGWGGFWGWDPVENSSLIPWLVAVALMHLLILQKRKGAFTRASLAAAFAYPALVFYSTFLTRSGVLSDFSVHSFSSGGSSGAIIVFLLFYVIAGGFLLGKAATAKGAPLGEKFFAWDTLVVYGAFTLLIFAAIVFIGTSMPIISGLVSQSKASVTENFYNNLSIPLGLMILAFMTFATMSDRLNKVFTAIAAAIAVAVSVAVNISLGGGVVAVAFVALAIFALLQYGYDFAVSKNKIQLVPSRLAHAGVVIFVMGCIASGFYTQSYRTNLVQGEQAEMGPVTLVFDKFNEGEQSSVAFTMEGSMGKKTFACPYYFTSGGRLYREPYIYSTLAGDLYITAEEFKSGKEAQAESVFAEGETKTLDGMNILFRNLTASGMTTGDPRVFAELVVNGVAVKPAISFAGGHRHPEPALIPGTQRRVSLAAFDIADKSVRIAIDPKPNATPAPDSVLVELSVKRLIWLVWFGVLLIAVGGGIALARAVRRKS